MACSPNLLNNSKINDNIITTTDYCIGLRPLLFNTSFKGPRS